MDGFKKRLNDSVQVKLSVTLSLAILASAIVAGLFSFMTAFDEAHELQDDVLLQVAQLVDRQGLLPTAPVANDPRVRHRDEDSRVIVQRLGATANLVLDTGRDAPLALPANLNDGLHTLTVAGARFRVLVKTIRTGERIAVSQEVEFRNEIARDGAVRTVMPLLILMPVLLLIVADLVRKLFRPIAVLSREVDGRDERELHPIESHRLPTEVRPFVVAINRLLARVDSAMASQRRFVADAAHELRSPLTALSLQAERLASADLAPAANERLLALREGIERSRSLLDQLLAFAKAQSAVEPITTALSVHEAFRRVLEDLVPLAEAKDIDIGVTATEDVRAQIGELDLIALVRNLVDNAIRYTPPGGRVDLSAHADDRGTVIRVEDTGPGIPLDERERVFDPFYRILGSGQIGSGLGLSIVRTIADRAGACIDLGFADEVAQRGLRVMVRFPS